MNFLQMMGVYDWIWTVWDEMIQKVRAKKEESKFKTYCELTLNQLFISCTQIVEILLKITGE